MQEEDPLHGESSASDEGIGRGRSGGGNRVISRVRRVGLAESQSEIR